MALNLLIDLLANTAQFDSAFDKSEKRIKAFAREANQAGQAAGKIGSALRVADVAGLDKLAAGSNFARAAIGGLTGALTLLGAVPVPLVLGAVGVGALIAWATSADTAAEKATALQERIDKLLMSQKAAAIAPMRAVAVEIGSTIDELQAKVQGAQQKLSNLPASDKADGSQSVALRATFEANRKVVAEGTAALEQKRAEYARVIQKIVETGKEFDAKDAAKGTSGAVKARVAQVADLNDLTKDQAAYLRELDAAMAVVADQDAEAFENKQRLAESIASYLNPALEAYRSRLAEISEALAVNAISEQDAAAARKKAAEDLAASQAKVADSQFAVQAARNIQNITASLLKGEQTGRSWAASIVGGLRDIAAELAAQQLLTALFGSWKGQEGWKGQFFSAVLGKRASGGPVSAGKPYLVGEKGPEIVVPGSSGTVVPNHKISAGAGITISPVINVAAGVSMADVAMAVGIGMRESQNQLKSWLDRGVSA